MKITIRPIAELKPAIYNPRTITDSQLEKLRVSIRTFGLIEPIVVNQFAGRENIIVGGHQRVKAAELEGLKDVPCVDVFLDQAKEKLLNIALNRISGEWDEAKLAEIIVDLNTEQADLTLSGMENLELINLIDHGTLLKIKNDEDEGDGPEQAQQITAPVSKRGEIYQLGEHRLMCGDSTSEEDMKQLMDGKKAGLFFSDPPYNVNYKESHNMGTAGINSIDGKGILNDHMESREFEELLTKAFTLAYRYTEESACCYVFHASKTYPEFAKALTVSGWYISQLIIWIKEMFVFALGAQYHRLFEPIIYGWKKDQKHYFDHEDTAKQKDVWMLNYDDENSKFFDVWKISRDKKKEYGHPTQKPTKLAERAMFNNSRRGEIVLDLFGGSGSTLIAAEKLGRKAYLMELDPRFCDVIRNRYQAYKEKTATPPLQQTTQ